ncbi:MAG: hypothetical protein KJ065_24840 [Anaerolineae bacterium]|nr:hypothetical protein [Anaerolineae bacterium]
MDTAKNLRILTLVWAPSETRTANYARQLNSPLYFIHYLLYKRPWIAPFKYLLQAAKTFQVLFKNRPRVVYVTNPPVFAPLCVLVYCKLTGAQFVMDTHPPSLYADRWRWSVPLQRFVSRFALMNVTDQERFKALFESWGAKALVLENPPKTPQFNAVKSEEHADRFKVAVVNTFAVDEPLDIILQAARQLPNAHFYITGDKGLAKPGVIENAPGNVSFTGYLRGDDYWNLLNNARAVMVLTTYPYSLLGGAQDSVSLHVPIILSDQPVLREYFTGGTVFVENTTDGIVKGVRQMMENEEQFKREVVDLRQVQKDKWEHNFQQLLTLIDAVK